MKKHLLIVYVLKSKISPHKIIKIKSTSKTFKLKKHNRKDKIKTITRSTEETVKEDDRKEEEEERTRDRYDRSVAAQKLLVAKLTTRAEAQPEN